ncbi:MAG: PDZ domain-containing protein [Acidimicrobiia bacterium]|nr:PDZ domain-containing protein [Acidimicrobiia bacterium]
MEDSAGGVPPPSMDHSGQALRAGRRRARWPWYAGGIVFAVVVVVTAGWFIRLPYYTIAPGSSLNVNERIEVTGARSYPPEGEVRLLFVRQRARVNVWRWLVASFDHDIDLFKEREFTGGQPPAQVRDEARADMAVAQFAARAVALHAVGYDLAEEGEGVRVLYVFDGLPAAGVLEEDDLIVAVDGEAVRTTAELGAAIGHHAPGETVRVTYVRDGERMRSELTTTAAFDDGRPVIGVQAVPPYDFPVEIGIDTDRIGGPSAGLAMTLAIIDELTPGELTGGRVVAVTGTIDLDGNVGPIGGSLRRPARRAADAEIFLVPACHEGAYYAECEADLDQARTRAGGMDVEEVASIDDALQALEAAGGAPLTQVG